MPNKGIRSYHDFSYRGKFVLLRLDINSPLEPVSRKITDRTRFKACLPTLVHLLKNGAKVAILAHQGDTLDYQNLISLEEHAEILTEMSGYPITYIDDVCGPSTIEAVKLLSQGSAVLLGNCRYLTEEVSTFEKSVKLTAEEMKNTWIVRKLAPLFDFYVNEAFSAAHRSCPSMVAFQEILPCAAGELFLNEYRALSELLHVPQRPSVFLLGGAKISDAFGMIEQVLKNQTADQILTVGVTGCIMLLAKGIRLGETYEKWLAEKDLLLFVEHAKKYLVDYPGRILFPIDLAYDDEGKRSEVLVDQLPIDDASFFDIGIKTMELYAPVLEKAGSIFVNGPAGVYEDERFAKGTQFLWERVAQSKAKSVIGGGDTVQAASKFVNLDQFSYVCTAGGAMVRFMTGKTLPLVEAMENNCFKRA